jgi:hypothetical protein
MKLHGLNKQRIPDVILVPPQVQKKSIKQQQAVSAAAGAVTRSRDSSASSQPSGKKPKTVVSRTNRSMSVTRFEKLPQSTTATGVNGLCDPLSGATVAFINKVFKVDPIKLKEEIKKKEEEAAKRSKETDSKVDPNYGLIYDYLKSC